MDLHARAQRNVRAPVERVFDFCTACENQPSMLRRAYPIPGVTHAELERPGLRVGAVRHARMTDGTEIIERIIELDRPRRYRYEWTRPPPAPFSLLVRGAEADWRFSSSSGETRVEWTYHLELTTPLVYPLAFPVLLAFERWMSLALDRVASEVERASSQSR